MGEEDALLHWETLFVVAACDSEDVSFPFVAEGVAGDFLRDFFVEEYAAWEGGVRLSVGGKGKELTIVFLRQCRGVFGPLLQGLDMDGLVVC